MPKPLRHTFAHDNPRLVVDATVERWPDPKVALWNEALSQQIGIARDEVLDFMHHPGHAQAYAGHQFGQFVPILGDGRAVLLGDVAGFDLQIKGSGPTPFARRGDGRAQLGPIVREFLMSEYLHAIGISTTRVLAVITTGHRIARRTVQPGAALIRVARSHVRVGTFQLAATQGPKLTAPLLEHTARIMGIESGPDLALRVYREALQRQATTVAGWMRAGFVHGVLNTDNTAVLGETLDYGPCAMIDAFDPGAVFSSIDETGRYAYGNQPNIIAWNMARFAEALLSLPKVEPGPIVEIFEGFSQLYRHAWCEAMSSALGFASARAENTGSPDGNQATTRTSDAAAADNVPGAASAPSPDVERLLDDLVELLGTRKPDYHEFLWTLAHDPETLPGWAQPWVQRWQALGPNVGAMRETTPAWIPRNFEVERVLEAVTAQSCDWDTVEEALARARAPYEGPVLPAPDDPAAPYVTYCGT